MLLYEEYIPEVKDRNAWEQYKMFIEAKKQSKEPEQHESKTNKHHIIPKCFLKTNKEKMDTRNLVTLSIPDHAEAHRLLAQAFQTAGLILAYNRLSDIPVKINWCKYRAKLGQERLSQLRKLHGGVYHTKKYWDKKTNQTMLSAHTEQQPQEKEETKRKMSTAEKADWLAWLDSVWKA